MTRNGEYFSFGSSSSNSCMIKAHEKGANWRSPMLILCESTICFGVVPKGLSNKIVRLVLAMFGCGLEFNGAKKNLPSSRNEVSLLLCHRCQVCATPSHPLRLGGLLLLLQLLSRHEGWCLFFLKKSTLEDGVRLCCNCFAAGKAQRLTKTLLENCFSGAYPRNLLHCWKVQNPESFWASCNELTISCSS